MGKKKSVLFLDKEGGFGGSSRSLFYLIKNLDKSEIVPYVLLREFGPIFDGYKKLGVTTFIKRNIPVYKPSLRKNFYILIQF